MIIKAANEILINFFKKVHWNFVQIVSSSYSNCISFLFCKDCWPPTIVYLEPHCNYKVNSNCMKDNCWRYTFHCGGIKLTTDTWYLSECNKIFTTLNIFIDFFLKCEETSIICFPATNNNSCLPVIVVTNLKFEDSQLCLDTF